MENHKLVLPEHLNHFGFLFGGHLLCWVDETAWIAASLEFPGHRFVTVAMDQVEFHRSVREGAILRLDATRARTGTTSVTYAVQVFLAGRDRVPPADPVFSTRVTLVRVDESGRKLPVSPP
jgi:acyl-CoA hydrolase